MTQAKKLGSGKYAPVLKELEMNEATNTELYNNASTQRRQAIDREIGSIQASGATAQKRLGDLGTSSASMYQKSIADSQSNSQALLDKVNTNNTNMLSSLQASMKERGVENVGDYSNLQGNLGKQNELFAALGNNQRNALELQQGLADQQIKGQQASSTMLDTTAQSGARGAAQTNFDKLYTDWLTKQGELDTAQAKTMLEKGDYTNQTYLTLKKEAALRKQEKAQLALEMHVAGLKNAQEMAKVSSSDYFKEAGLKLKQADMNLKGRALDARIAQMKRSGDLGEAKLLETIRNNNSKNRREDAKAKVTYTPPKSIAKK